MKKEKKLLTFRLRSQTETWAQIELFYELADHLMETPFTFLMQFSQIIILLQAQNIYVHTV